MDTAHHAPIVSSLPGRLRLRDARLRRDALREAVLARLDTLPALRTLRANAAAGSIVVEYDGTRVGEALMCREVLDAVAPWLAAPATAAPAAVPAPPRRASRRRQLARANNLGMLASLGGSLALAAAGAKSAHVATGTVFLGLLGVHLAMHRRSLLR
ncbi:hypothetical protein [Rubrivivax benzoatilyticus]|uniref:Uncharacterized protein n=2 Tax=Rubrivivax benzoatilyticus TaxID=316997 RepID=A0ABX0HX37_9BURK|nr:hypothetical protein [Rubrivivax benzoatilyticus]NHK99577.1 hypothetical protein [Rubrivivax benzoatilyticus]NHL25451.1 hypothetical protein [Rubrivivax benzoatilyticus]